MCRWSAFFLSEEKRVGIGTFSPSDPKSQDIADLTGSIDFSTIAEYGSESDPRAYRFDGELNKANRGLMEFQEMLKCDEKFLWHLLSLTQEGNFKAGRFALISADELIVAHTNEAEYRRLSAIRKRSAAVTHDRHACSVQPDRFTRKRKFTKSDSSRAISACPHRAHALKGGSDFFHSDPLERIEKTRD